jgi:hypothetical protein
MKVSLTATTILFSLLFATSCTGQHFTTDYIQNNKGKWSIEVPEVQELVHIVIALTPVGLADSNLVEHESAYYTEVMAHFGKYRNSEIVTKINQELKSNWSLYSRIKMDACGFYFDNNRIIQDKTYNQLNWSNKNYVKPYLKLLEDFAIETGFRDFFSTHKTYYDHLTTLMHKQLPVAKQWKWLEERFPLVYDNYKITFSPLVRGSHSTNKFESKNFKQTIMFICGPIEQSQFNEAVVEGLMTRVVFTEIDHNYVNPISDKYKNEINKIFADRQKWTTGKDANHYKSPMLIFNEYMTWSVFALYALDNFSGEDFKVINDRVTLQMSQRRDFSKFKEFNQKMIELYEASTSKLITDLYPAILEWCKNQ